MVQCPDAVSRFALAVHHGLDVPYVYGFSDIGTNNSESRLVSQAMMDYWISFAVSGTPNDGKGLSSTCCVPFCSLCFANWGLHIISPGTIWPQYESNNQVRPTSERGDMPTTRTDVWCPSFLRCSFNSTRRTSPLDRPTQRSLSFQTTTAPHRSRSSLPWRLISTNNQAAGTSWKGMTRVRP